MYYPWDILYQPSSGSTHITADFSHHELKQCDEWFPRSVLPNCLSYGKPCAEFGQLDFRYEAFFHEAGLTLYKLGAESQTLFLHSKPWTPARSVPTSCYNGETVPMAMTVMRVGIRRVDYGQQRLEVLCQTYGLLMTPNLMSRRVDCQMYSLYSSLW